MAERKSNTADAEKDFLSSHFNPRTVLYSDDVSIPCPNAREFQTVSEYENFMAKKRKEKRDKEELKISSANAGVDDGNIPSTSSSNSKSSDLTAIENANRRKCESSETHSSTLSMDPTKMAIDTAKEKKGTRHTSTIFSRIDELHEVGPLSLLKKCMTKNLVVKVVVRNARGVRGYCRGYVVAFDNHFNMAMRDVDEVYKNPLWTSRSARRRFTKQRLNKSERDENSSKVASAAPCRDIATSFCTTATRVEDISRHDSTTPSERVSDMGDNHETLAPSTEMSTGVWRAVEEPSDVPEYSQTSDTQTAGSTAFEPQNQTLRRHVNQLFIKGDNVVVVVVGNRGVDVT